MAGIKTPLITQYWDPNKSLNAPNLLNYYIGCDLANPFSRDYTILSYYNPLTDSWEVIPNPRYINYKEAYRKKLEEIAKYYWEPEIYTNT